MPAEPVKFGYWVPDVGGGPVTGKSEQRTDRSDDHNREPARPYRLEREAGSADTAPESVPAHA